MNKEKVDRVLEIFHDIDPGDIHMYSPNITIDGNGKVVDKGCVGALMALALGENLSYCPVTFSSYKGEVAFADSLGVGFCEMSGAIKKHNGGVDPFCIGRWQEPHYNALRNAVEDLTGYRHVHNEENVVELEFA